VLFRIIIPCDARLSPAIRQIAERVAQCAGYSAAEAVRVASGVGQAAEALMARSSGEFDIRFQRESRFLDVVFRRRACPGDSPETIENAAVSSEAMRLGMESVEFGVEDEVAYCRLRRVLPDEKVDHQCEMPPQE
jgi:hypothetical protein